MKHRYTTIIIGAIVLVTVGLLTGCVTLRPATIQMNKDIRAYTHVYIPATQTKESAIGVPVVGVILPYAQSVNPRDVIAGGFSKRGFIVLHDIEERVRPKTLIVSYGESERRRVALGMGSTTEVILQLVSAETGELVGTATAEGCGDTESDDIKQAITRALAALFK
nr:hypothetical protein [uncultured Porphyromonas sp.]